MIGAAMRVDGGMSLSVHFPGEKDTEFVGDGFAAGRIQTNYCEDFYAMISRTTFPCTSVNRKSRPVYRYVSRS